MNRKTEKPTVASLVQDARLAFEAKMKEIAKKDAENKAKVVELTASEKMLSGLIKEIKAARLRMMDSYEKVEREKTKKNLEAVREEEYTKEDVASGKITAERFLAIGKEDEEVRDMARTETLLELEKLSDLIREKSVELTKTEIDLHQARNEIYVLAYLPARELQQGYRQLEDSLTYLLGPVASEFSQAQAALDGAKKNLCIMETGICNDNALGWPSLSKQEAGRLIHDARLPKKYAADLLSQLDEVDEGALVNVTLWFAHSATGSGEHLEVRQEIGPAEED